MSYPEESMTCMFLRAEHGVNVKSFLQALSILSGVYSSDSFNSLVDLLLDLVAAKNVRSDCLSICPELLRLFTEQDSVPLHVLLVIGRHMFFYGTVLVGTSVKPPMDADEIHVKEDLDSRTNHANIHLLLGILIRHRAIRFIHRDVVIECYRSDLPSSRFKLTWR